jgi:hypothetical protein
VGEEVRRDVDRDLGARLLEVLAAFDDERGAGAFDLPVRAVLDQRRPEPSPAGMTRCTAGRGSERATAALRSNAG